MTVDPSVLDGLTARLGDKAAGFRASLIRTWRDECTSRLRGLDDAVASGDRDAVMVVAHTLRSSAAALGASVLAATCEDVESALRAGEARDLAADAAALKADTAAADAEFTRLWG
ncbi:MAG: domain S-box [Frankiales bacterium]|nr:domain S-box [Frankiales bacterium]